MDAGEIPRPSRTSRASRASRSSEAGSGLTGWLDGTSSGNVTGTLNSIPTTTFRIEVFSSPSPDPSGFGEGRTLLGTVNVSTDASGNAAFTVPVALSAGGGWITATATRLDSALAPVETSEFSAAIAIAPYTVQIYSQD